MSVVKSLRRRANRVLDTGLSFLPAETVVHLGNASSELLRAARALIDEQIVWTGRHVDAAAAIRRERRAGGGAPTDLATEGPSRPD